MNEPPPRGREQGVGRLASRRPAALMADEPEPELLESAFWGPGGEYLVITKDVALRVEHVYGPFFNADVASMWATDMGLEQATLRTIEPPPKV